jgi:hypothetical protein
MLILDLEQFIVNQRKRLLEENAKRLLERKKTIKGKDVESKNTGPQTQEPKTIVLKNLEGNKNKNKDDNTQMDSNLLVEEMNKEALAIFEREDVRPEFEILQHYAEQAKDNFFMNLMMSPADIIGNDIDTAQREHMQQAIELYTETLFQELEKKAVELKENHVNFFSDFKLFLNIMLRALETLVPNSPTYSAYLMMMRAFGKAMRDDKNSSSIIFLESVGLESILEFARLHSNKKDALVDILMAICPEGDAMHLRLLKRIEKILGTDYNTLSGVLAHLSVHQAAEGFEGEILEFYWTKAIYITGYPSAKMKTNGLKILNEISKFNTSKISGSYATLRLLCQDVWWEIKAQILIICANQLELIEMVGQEEAGRDNRSNHMHNTQEHGEETVEAAIPRIDPEGNFNRSQHTDPPTDRQRQANPANRSQLNEFEKTHESRPGMDGSDFQIDKQNSIVHLLELVSRIFHRNANVNVQKIGLIYLAKVLNYYPTLCQRYLEVLLSVEDDVRETVLDISPENQGEYNVVLSNLL